MRREPEALPNGKTVAIPPALLPTKSAAIFCACSPSLLDHLRVSDAKRLRRGAEIEGPAWVRVSFGIRYRVADLEAWLDRTSVVCGVMASRRRGKLSDVSNDPEPPAET